MTSPASKAISFFRYKLRQIIMNVIDIIPTPIIYLVFELHPPPPPLPSMNYELKKSYCKTLQIKTLLKIIFSIFSDDFWIQVRKGIINKNSIDRVEFKFNSFILAETEMLVLSHQSY